MDFDEYYAWLFAQVGGLLEGVGAQSWGDQVEGVIDETWERRYYETWSEVEQFRALVPRRTLWRYDYELKGFILYVERDTDRRKSRSKRRRKKR